MNELFTSFELQCDVLLRLAGGCNCINCVFELLRQQFFFSFAVLGPYMMTYAWSLSFLAIPLAWYSVTMCDISCGG